MTKAWSYSGSVDITGKINLTGIEPMTNEKIWSKSVVIPSVDGIQVKTERSYAKPDPKVVAMDPGIANPIGSALSEDYGNIMSKMEAHLSPEEFVSIKNDISKLKSKKGF